MRTLLIRIVGVLTAALMAATVYAQPQGLERVGPTSPANGFPTWYQDKTGLALEFCQPQTQAELDGGWCLLLPGDTTVPEAFPNTFAGEHFFFAADASIENPQGIRAELVIGLEAAFAADRPVAGDQIVFARIRFRIDPLPATGVYTIYHPYGTDQIEGVAGERLFFTEDIGIGCGGFECALTGRIGPFLLASNTPGGAELPAVAGPVAGKMYLANPARLGPITGSPVGQNYFRIVGPAGSGFDVQTANFSLMGRVFQGTMPARLTVDRASYARSAEQGRIDVFATAFATTPTRLPATAPAPVVLPLLDFFPAPCAIGATGLAGAPSGVSPLPMISEGSRYYGQVQEGPIPAGVCVRDNTARNVNGQIDPIYKNAPLVDQVRILRAEFNPASGGRLRVDAQSSDAFAPPQLTALLVGPLAGAPMATGEAAIIAPPESIVVTSVRGGRAELDVSTVTGVLSPTTRPLAGNDTAAMNEDAAAPLLLAVLANDTISGRLIVPSDTPVVSIVGAPRLGTANTNADGSITYAPNPNANGVDLLTYTVSVAGQASSPAFVSITIANVNDAPVAVNDSITTLAGLGVSVPLLLNDLDVDGTADLRNAVITAAPAGVIHSVVNGVLTLSAGAGTHIFRYRAVDAAGAQSANEATVTVTLTGPSEQVAIVRAEFTASKRRWRVEGTSTVANNQAVYIMYADGVFADGTTAVGYLVGTTQVGATAAFVLDLTLAGANDPRNLANTALFAVRPTRVVAMTALGGTSPAATITVR